MNELRDPGPPNGGIMVVRVWNEGGRPDAFRARLTYGTGDDDSRSTVFADPDEVLESVRAWLTTFTHAPGAPRIDGSN
jgi:hypothetical protein